MKAQQLILIAPLLWVAGAARGQAPRADHGGLLSETAGQALRSVAPTRASLAPDKFSADGESGAPITLTLRDALERARANDPRFLSVMTDAKIAREDRIQSRAALLPSVNFTSQYLNTQGNGTLSSGRFVTNDGVHVYRVWAVVHQDLRATTFTMAPYRRAAAAEALAQAKAEIARRGLAVTVTKGYYALVVAQRKYATAQQAMEQARRFLTISQDLERGGEVAPSDVIKARLQFNQQQRDFQEAQLAMEKARLELAVILFANFNQNFTVVDDLDSAQALPPFTEVRAMAQRENPDLRAAIEAVRQSSLDVSIARASFLPSLTLDVDYGIEANALALRSRISADPLAGRLPNLGYFATATLSLPVWDWGALRSKLHQAQVRRQQARAELTFAQRELLSNLSAFYKEAELAKAEVDTLRSSAELAAESLRLTTLRYQAGEATVLEVVDAQNTLTQARHGYDDGQARYRVALANLQTLTGTF